MKSTLKKVKTDFELLDEIKSDDKSSFKILFEKYYSQLSRFANLYLKNLDIAEDIVQEFFVQFWIKRNEISINTSVKSYFYQSIRNRALNYNRDKKESLSINSDLEKVENLLVTEIKENFDFSIMKNAFNSAVESLPEKCKVIFKMSREEGLTYKQISEKLNLSQKTVESQMRIALMKMREKLKPMLESLISIIIIFFQKNIFFF
ncbi:MAG: RNA polymerase sigma-70 factor [Rhodothermaceae bacterium]